MSVTPLGSSCKDIQKMCFIFHVCSAVRVSDFIYTSSVSRSLEVSQMSTSFPGYVPSRERTTSAFHDKLDVLEAGFWCA